MREDIEAVIRLVEQLPVRDRSYWYLGLSVARMIAAKRDSENAGDREFMRQIGAWLQQDYDESPPAARDMLAGYVRHYWLP